MIYRQVEIFCAVMERASVTEAARHLGLSQPAVSKSLKSLEDELGLQLFTRTTRRLVATDEGRELYGEAQRALQGFESLGIVAKGLHRLEHARLAVGVMPALATAWLARVAVSFSEAHPGVSLAMRALGSAEIVRQVARGELDVGVGQVREHDPAIIKRKLSDLHLVCLVPSTHRLASRPVIDGDDLVSEPLVVLSGKDEFRRMLDGKLLSRGIQLGASLEASQSMMIGFLVEAGGRIGILDNETASLGKWPSMVTVPLRPAIRTPVYVTHNTRSTHNLATKRFCEHILSMKPGSRP